MDSGKKTKRYKLLNRILLWGQKQIERRAWFLAPFSWLWGFFSFLRNRLYDFQLLPIYSVPRPVISVGNIVAGGTGKTPFVHLLAKTFSSYRVAILCSGYGALPDEAWLLQRKLPEVRVYIGKDRYKNAKLAVADGADLLIVDDGFQHRRLARDFDLVLLDGTDPLGKGHYLPFGYLRDPPSRLQQADALFIAPSHPDFPQAIVLNTRAVGVFDQNFQKISSVKGMTCGMFCGLAKPEKFRKTLQELGIEVQKEWILADHEPADLSSLDAFAQECKKHGIKFLICTEKDFVKLPKNLSLILPLLWVEIEVQIVSHTQQWEKLIEKIRQKIDNRISI